MFYLPKYSDVKPLNGSDPTDDSKDGRFSLVPTWLTRSNRRGIRLRPTSHWVNTMRRNRLLVTAAIPLTAVLSYSLAPGQAIREGGVASGVW